MVYRTSQEEERTTRRGGSLGSVGNALKAVMIGDATEAMQLPLPIQFIADQHHFFLVRKHKEIASRMLAHMARLRLIDEWQYRLYLLLSAHLILLSRYCHPSTRHLVCRQYATTERIA